MRTYVGSLASVPESGDFLADYSSQNTTQEISAAEESKKIETSSSSSMLERVYNSTSSSSQQVIFSANFIKIDLFNVFYYIKEIHKRDFDRHVESARSRMSARRYAI